MGPASLKMPYLVQLHRKMTRNMRPNRRLAFFHGGRAAKIPHMIQLGVVMGQGTTSPCKIFVSGITEFCSKNRTLESPVFVFSDYSKGLCIRRHGSS